MKYHHLSEASPYTEAEFENLKQRVLEFMQKQPGYSGKSLAVVWAPHDGGVYIQYGENLHNGIAGFGETPEQAFQDFLRDWKSGNGEAWISKNGNAFN